MDYKTLVVSLENNVARIVLNRPDKANALDLTMWHEFRSALEWADETPEVRVVVVSGAGKNFCAGIDLTMLASIGSMVDDACEGRRREKFRRLVLDLQDCLSAAERCRKPVIAAIHGACFGGGIDLVTACDIRYCSADARFSVKEIDLAITADVGTLQRLPRLVGEGIARELAYTARSFDGAEAEAMRLVNRCYATPEELTQAVGTLAAEMAAKSPLAMRGTKEMISYVRDHSVADSLNYVATWNAAMLFSKDLEEAVSATFQKRPARFVD